MMVLHYTHPLPVAGLQLLLSCLTQATPVDHNSFLYHYFPYGEGRGQLHYNGLKLHVESTQRPVSAVQGGEATLPCWYRYDPELSSPRKVRVKWSWIPAIGDHEMDVLVAIGSHNRTFGEFRGRVHLRQDSPGDASLFIADLQLNDTGRYRCQIIDGLEDESVLVDLELRGVVFPYQPPRGRYHLNFMGAKQACEDQGATLATFQQLFQAWKDGFDWCNAGWLADGTVQYPITQPRVSCGGHSLAPGLRSYGRRHRHLHRFDAFCFASALPGKVFYLQPSQKLNQTEAQVACQDHGAEIANVGQLYSAWKFLGLDRCDAGWLADGSLRYPISRPRRNCGPSEPGVRSFGFPPPNDKHGVYCYSAVQ